MRAPRRAVQGAARDREIRQGIGVPGRGCGTRHFPEGRRRFPRYQWIMSGDAQYGAFRAAGQDVGGFPEEPAEGTEYLRQGMPGRRVQGPAAGSPCCWRARPVRASPPCATSSPGWNVRRRAGAHRRRQDLGHVKIRPGGRRMAPASGPTDRATGWRTGTAAKPYGSPRGAVPDLRPSSGRAGGCRARRSARARGARRRERPS